MEAIVQNIWTKGKLLIKAFIIAGLVLLLMIPAMFVKELIEERESRQREAIAEVSSKWASDQNIAGPVVVLPYWQEEGDSAKKVRSKHFAYFLPDELHIKSTLQPEEKHRGIYKVMLYSSITHLTGTFGEIDPQKLNIPAENILWNEAFLKMNLSDNKGLNEEPAVNWNGQQLTLSPQTADDPLSENGLIAPLELKHLADIKQARFDATINLNGAEQLLFTPLGKITTVQMQSPWPHPSFTGDLLPQTTQVKDSGFAATWKSLAHRRNFPQHWKDGAYHFSGMDNRLESRGNDVATSAFGVSLFVPVNGYQKTLRSVKYAVLCILLTFAAFFIMETRSQRSVHPFQYGLIGLALILFYTLLLSFSEYVGFNLSYMLASVATIGLIAWFVKGILSSRLALLLCMVLLLLYTYVFTILQLQDYALLLGSIGLFLTLAIIMSYSRKIQW